MNNLTTRKIVLGLLMVCVLALRVQGSAEALTLTETSPVIQSKRMGSTFEITFSVGLISTPSATTAYDDQSPRRRVTDHNTFPDDWPPESYVTPADDGTAIRIDSSGYQVWYIGSTAYRFTAAGDGDLRPTGGEQRALSLNSRGVSADDNEPTTGRYVDSSGNVVDGNGKAIYIRTGASGSYKYTRAKADPQNAVDSKYRSDYNEEMISITSDSATITIKDKNDGQLIVTEDGTTGNMSENSRFGKLQSKVALICKPTAPGTYKITIEDTTPVRDVPRLDVGRTPAPITFTLHVTPATTDVDSATITPDIQRIPTNDAVEPVRARLTFTPADGNNRIRYEVVKGSGKLYVGTLEEEYTTASSVITVHQASDVFLNTNETSNEVHVWFAGEDRSAPRATIIFEYRGKPLPQQQNQQNQQNQQQQNQPTNTITISPSSLSGTPGGTETITISNPAGVQVNLSGSGFTFSPTSGRTTSFQSTVTLPSSSGSYTITATGVIGGNTISDSTSVTVTSPGTLTARQDGGQIYVTASPAPSSNLAFTLTSGGARVGGGEILTAGWGRAIPVGLTAGSHILTVDADGYNATQVSFTPGSTPATGQPQQQPEQQQQQAVGGTAESIEIEGSRTLEGTVDTSTQLRARVLDANDRGVSDVRVTFRILAPGRGRLSQRGNGRAVQVNTDRNGYATASLTPLGGNLIVEAKAAGVTAAVTFIIDVDGSAPAATQATGTTGAARSYKVGDKIPLSLEDTLNFTGSRTVNGTTYTCVGSGECVVSYGTLVKGEIRSATVSTQAKAYKVGDKIPLSLQDTLSFRGSRTENGTTYTCVGSGECVVSYGTLVKGEIRGVSAKTTASDTGEIPVGIDPVVHAAAAQRPPMLWVDQYDMYALVGANVQRFIPSVTGVIDIAIGGNKVYWTKRTGESSGTINSANLDGSGTKELAAIMAVPHGIAVDTTGSKLYWTNSRHRIQSANLDGSSIRNVLQNLNAQGFPTDITVDRGIVYWTMDPTHAESPKIGVVNPTARGVPKYISTGSKNIPENLVVSGGKVYWTEQSGEWTAVSESEAVFDPDSRGTVHSANLNGTGAKQLASIQAVPIGIAVDTARSKLYWTNSRGRIQSANLDGSGITNVVDGLGMPGDIVLSNSLKAPTGTSTTTTAGKSKYDINGDGTVDSKDSDALTVALAAGITDAKYDVNGDGKVDIHDLVAVNANRTSGAASAPALIGNIKLSAIQIDRLQEQIELLIATGDRSPAAMKTLIYLQQLIAMARPEQTQLFANYPNPFNPETWMPYELATDTNVRITIYNTQGVVIRTLVLGHQSAGYYTDRERAAYWDGKNAQGEQVASGVYFYQLETDTMSLMRKMVILK